MTLTTKRQATLPRELCEELGVHPGDQIDLERAVIDDKPVWVLRPHRLDWSWIGSAKVAADASHDLDDIRASVARGRAREQRP
jgi:bifunctional DNA-binding transcriptional regulator/antitoxin component of YhaV-PrlF toxin-antitoxin module